MSYVMMISFYQLWKDYISFPFSTNRPALINGCIVSVPATTSLKVKTSVYPASQAKPRPPAKVSLPRLYQPRLSI